jgi:hypothetical protein
LATNLATNRLAKGWHRLTCDIGAYEFFVNLICPIILLIVSYINLFHNPHNGWWIAEISIFVVDVYIFFLLVLAALKLPKHIPERQVALVTIPVLFLVLVVSFGRLYIQNGHVVRSVNPCAQLSDSLRHPADAAYFSLVTITTLGYGDYAPEREARHLVVGELFSGALLLFLAFPVLGSRLAQFDETEGTTIRCLSDGSWEIRGADNCPVKYPKGKRLTVTLEAQGVTQASSSDV